MNRSPKATGGFINLPKRYERLVMNAGNNFINFCQKWA
jgi:hypothetical protein